MDAMGLGWVINLAVGNRPLILQKSGGLQGYLCISGYCAATTAPVGLLLFRIRHRLSPPQMPDVFGHRIVQRQFTVVDQHHRGQVVIGLVIEWSAKMVSGVMGCLVATS
jgi:hypothetical protein